jgi:hypothetical protein
MKSGFKINYRKRLEKSGWTSSKPNTGVTGVEHRSLVTHGSVAQPWELPSDSHGAVQVNCYIK